MSRKGFRKRRPGGKVVAATKADTGTDPAFDSYGAPSRILLSADGTVKMTTVEGDIVSLALFGKVEYELAPKLVWDTGTSAITVNLIY